MRVLLSSLLAIAVAAPLSAVAETVAAEPGKFETLATLVQKVKDATAHPAGTAIAVIKDGRIVYEGYFGFADIQNKVAVDRDTAFYIASATKPFTALNALLQEDQGRLDTRTSLQALFPRAAFNDFDAKAITMRDLLTHTSGIDNQPLVWATAFSGIHDAGTRQRLVEQSYPNVDAALGAFDYSNVGYNILSVWRDSEFATPWQQQLDDNIFSPLGMTGTSAYMTGAKAGRRPLARPYSALSSDRSVPLYLEKVDQTMHAAGGMVATAPDLARFLQAQLAHGKLDGSQVLPRAVIEKSQVQQTATNGKGYQDFQRTGYAWGWYVGDYKGRKMLHHFGGFAGFHAHLSFIPEANVGLVILNNEDFIAAQVTSLIADQVYGELLGEAGIDAKVSARLDGLLEKARGLDAVVAKEQQKIGGRVWDLSQPIEAYVGSYANPLLGELTVRLDAGNRPIVDWGQLSAPATAYEARDHARVEFAPNSGQVIKFIVSADRVEAVAFDGMRFTKTR